MKLIILACIGLLAAVEGNHQAVAADDLPANFSGTVVDTAEGVPIRDTHVWIHEWSNGPAFEAEPGPIGKFATKLPDGYYEVMVASPGFQPVSKSIWIDHGNSIRWRVTLCADTENMQDVPDPGPSSPQCSKIWSLK